MKKRYTSGTNRWRGRRATIAENIGWATSIPPSVALNSQARFLTPPATAISSRMGRRM